jgi:hypothetical protein
LHLNTLAHFKLENMWLRLMSRFRAKQNPVPAYGLRKGMNWQSYGYAGTWHMGLQLRGLGFVGTYNNAKRKSRTVPGGGGKPRVNLALLGLSSN